MNNCRDWAFSNSGLEVWVPAFQLPSLQNVKHCRMEICSPCLFKSSIPTILCGNSKPPFPTRSLRLLRAAVCSTTSALWLHHSHPFVAAAGKACLMQRSKGFGHGDVVFTICYWVTMQWLCVLSVMLCDCWKPMNNCPDWALSNIGLEVWLPTFQLPKLAKCDALPNGDLFDMFV